MGNYLFITIISLIPLSSMTGQCLNFQVNDASDQDFWGVDDGLITQISATFGVGEFTFQLWILPDTSFEVSSTGSGSAGRALNWSDSDEMPNSYCCWWYRSNFLLDGHANGGDDGTFSFQFYGGGRLRWHFEDQFDYVVTQAYPATNTFTLLDGKWHLVSCVRKFIPGDSSRLELWVDNTLVATEHTQLQTNMHQYRDNWFGSWSQPGWYLGCEKQVAPGDNDHNEDYKGLVDEMRFYDLAKSAGEIMADYERTNGCGSNNGLVGYFTFSEAMDDMVCDSIDNNYCWTLYNLDSFPNLWNSTNAPYVGSCAETLTLTIVDSPLSGSYTVSSQIIINGPLQIATGSMLFLNAPDVCFDEDITILVTSELSIIPNGCN